MANFAYSKTVNQTLGMSSGVGGTDLTRSRKNEILFCCLPLSSILCLVMLVNSRSTSNTPEPGETMMIVWPVRSKLRSIWCLLIAKKDQEGHSDQ